MWKASRRPESRRGGSESRYVRKDSRAPSGARLSRSSAWTGHFRSRAARRIARSVRRTGGEGQPARSALRDACLELGRGARRAHSGSQPRWGFGASSRPTRSLPIRARARRLSWCPRGRTRANGRRRHRRGRSIRASGRSRTWPSPPSVERRGFAQRQRLVCSLLEADPVGGVRDSVGECGVLLRGEVERVHLSVREFRARHQAVAPLYVPISNTRPAFKKRPSSMRNVSPLYDWFPGAVHCVGGSTSSSPLRRSSKASPASTGRASAARTDGRARRHRPRVATVGRVVRSSACLLSYRVRRSRLARQASTNASAAASIDQR